MLLRRRLLIGKCVVCIGIGQLNHESPWSCGGNAVIDHLPIGGMGAVVHEVRALIGPKDVDVAKEEADV